MGYAHFSLDSRNTVWISNSSDKRVLRGKYVSAVYMNIVSLCDSDGDM